MAVSVWEALFMLVVLKIPVVYLAAVVWWAIRAEPSVTTGGDEAGVPASLDPCDWDSWRRGRSRRWPGRRPRRPLGGRGGLSARGVRTGVPGGMSS